MTKFRVFPVLVGVAYRFDMLYRNIDIPLVPYVKGGGEYIIWWVTGGEGETSKSDASGDGLGGKKGLFFRPGLQVALNWLDEDAGKHFDNSVGINESYFFGEYCVDMVNSFSSEGLNLTYYTWLAGIMFEF